MATDLNLLVSLDALLSEASVTRAAERVGLSTPAMSHALSRLRTQLEDPLLVRSGRGMALTARAAELRGRVHSLLDEVQRVLAPAEPTDLRRIQRTFRILATDYVLLMLGHGVDELGRSEAPEVVLRFVPNSPDDAHLLREGLVELAVGVFGPLPPELRTQKLFDERLVCVARDDHPSVRQRLTLKRYTDAEHIQVSPRGQPGGVVDEQLARDGLRRRVTRTVPFFLSALHLVADSDHLLTVPERVARAVAPRFGLRVLDLPIDVPSYAVRQIWHPRHENDPAHVWLRTTFARVAHDTRPRRRKSSH